MPISKKGLLLCLMILYPLLTAITEPEWLASRIYDEYVRQDRVPLPWTEVKARGRKIEVWGRVMEWKDNIFPDSIKSQGRELLAGPIRIVVEFSGRKWTIPLKVFRITKIRKSRVDIIAEGEVNGIKAYADMWVEFDGFLWVSLRMADREKERKVESLKVLVPLRKDIARLYQTFSRRLAGWISDKPIEFSWLANPNDTIVNFYHWFGDEEGGIGFTYTSLQYWAPKSENNFSTLVPGEDSHIYIINLIEKAVKLDGRIFKFGIQATPIKPLPPDYFAFKACTLFYDPWKALNRLNGDVDMSLLWPQPNGEAMVGLNNPYNVRRDIIEKARDYCHQRGIAFLGVAHCPQKISPIIGEEFIKYGEDWKALPESILEWEGVPHYQDCGRSYTLRKWLFYGWLVKNVKELGLDGIYCDGWMTGQMGCANFRHGCGWKDEEGKWHLTVPVLEGREFNKVVALFLEDNVRTPLPRTASKREGFPRYHFWIHSWEFVPSIMGFATEWLTGEFSGWPLEGPSMLTSEGTYGKCLGLGLFRARCLSTNWGVPNLFDPIMWENTENHPTDRQTLMAYAWFLPHGVPIGLLEYMNQNTVVKISNVLKKFGVRSSIFTPGWRKNPFWKIEEPVAKEVMLATWHKKDNEDVLAVVSNLFSDRTVSVKIRWLKGANVNIKNALSGEPVEIKENICTLKLEPESFIMLLAERRVEKNILK
ncbi:hypothetical protein H5T87_08530 [bacterium]|nr:hypothetical protein [bacterium]